MLAITLGVVAALTGLILWSQSEWVIDARSSRIRSVIAAQEASHLWAGTYYRGDGFGSNELLNVSEREGFQYTNHGCLGLYGHAHGSTGASGSRVTLDERVVGLPAGRFGEYEVVDWGSRRYLVEPRQLLDFVNAVNQHSHEEYGRGLIEDRRFYLRCGDEQKELEGKPVLPAEFARWLLPHRIEGHVTAVAGQDASPCDERVLGTVDIDLGLDQGAFQGMELYLTAETDGFGTAVLIEVAENSSRGKVNSWASRGPLPAVGWTAASRLGD